MENQLLETIAEQYKIILQDNLIGIYAHGSIGFDCFNWDRSDIDFIVVVKSPLSQKVKLLLLDVLVGLNNQAPPKGFEMSVVLEQYCNNFIYPTPYELHFGNDWLTGYLNNPQTLCNDEAKTDEDLAAHFTVIRHVGVVVCGKPIAVVFGEVPRADYLDSIRKDIENAKEYIIDYPVYIILNLCRVYAYMRDGVVISKEKGGQWGLANLSQKYHDLITAMLDNYVKGTEIQIDKPIQIDFAEYMLGLIFTDTKSLN